MIKIGIKSVSMAKELHSRLSKNREFARNGFFMDDKLLHEIQDTAMKIAKMTYEIQAIKREIKK